MKGWIALTAGAALAATATLPAYAAEVEGPRVSWNVSWWGAPRAATMGIEEVAKLVREKTGGNFAIRIAYGEALSKARENLDGIKLGAFEGAVFCNFYHPGKNPTANALSLPFLPMPDLETIQYVSEALYEHPAYVNDMAQWNAMVYMGNPLPLYEAMGRGNPPRTLADWKGMRVRAGGGMGDAMVELGASKMTVPAPEVYTMIERGTIDAVTFPFTYAFQSYRTDEVSQWYTTNLALGTADCPTVFNRDAYNRLPEQYKKLLEDVKAPAYNALFAAYREHDAKNLAIWEKKLEAVTYTEEELTQFRETAGRPVWNAWVKEWEDKIPAQEVLDYVLAQAEAAAARKRQ